MADYRPDMLYKGGGDVPSTNNALKIARIQKLDVRQIIASE